MPVAMARPAGMSAPQAMATAMPANALPMAAPMEASAAAASAGDASRADTLGFATGGAQDIENFRRGVLLPRRLLFLSRGRSWARLCARQAGAAGGRRRQLGRSSRCTPHACAPPCRENVKSGYLPLPTDLTFGGLSKGAAWAALWAALHRRAGSARLPPPPVAGGTSLHAPAGAPAEPSLCPPLPLPRPPPCRLLL